MAVEAKSAALERASDAVHVAAMGGEGPLTHSVDLDTLAIPTIAVRATDTVSLATNHLRAYRRDVANHRTSMETTLRDLAVQYNTSETARLQTAEVVERLGGHVDVADLVRVPSCHPSVRSFRFCRSTKTRELAEEAASAPPKSKEHRLMCAALSSEWNRFHERLYADKLPKLIDVPDDINECLLNGLCVCGDDTQGVEAKMMLSRWEGVVKSLFVSVPERRELQLSNYTVVFFGSLVAEGGGDGGFTPRDGVEPSDDPIGSPCVGDERPADEVAVVALHIAWHVLAPWRAFFQPIVPEDFKPMDDVIRFSPCIDWMPSISAFYNFLAARDGPENSGTAGFTNFAAFVDARIGGGTHPAG